MRAAAVLVVVVLASLALAAEEQAVLAGGPQRVTGAGDRPVREGYQRATFKGKATTTETSSCCGCTPSSTSIAHALRSIRNVALSFWFEEYPVDLVNCDPETSSTFPIIGSWVVPPPAVIDGVVSFGGFSQGMLLHTLKPTHSEQIIAKFHLAYNASITEIFLWMELSDAGDYIFETETRIGFVVDFWPTFIGNTLFMQIPVRTATSKSGASGGPIYQPTSYTSQPPTYQGTSGYLSMTSGHSSSSVSLSPSSYSASGSTPSTPPVTTYGSPCTPSSQAGLAMARGGGKRVTQAVSKVQAAYEALIKDVPAEDKAAFEL